MLLWSISQPPLPWFSQVIPALNDFSRCFLNDGIFQGPVGLVLLESFPYSLGDNFFKIWIRTTLAACVLSNIMNTIVFTSPPIGFMFLILAFFISGKPFTMCCFRFLFILFPIPSTPFSILFFIFCVISFHFKFVLFSTTITGLVIFTFAVLTKV